jgi:DNA polymerase III subunit delta
MAELKPAYLIHGDDHGAIAERRAGLRALAEGEEGGAGSVELLEGEAATPAGVALALAAMTLPGGRRVLLVEGVERWRQAEVEQHLAPALQAMPPDTTLALFAREEGRTRAPAAVAKAVKAAGGQVVEQALVKPWELGRWVREQAASLGLALDGAAAKALIAQVGERQQRLLRELEKLALVADPARDADDSASDSGASQGSARGSKQAARGSARFPLRVVTAEEIDAAAAHSAEWRVYSLADALVGANASEATRCYLRLREQGERLPWLTSVMAQRLREALAIARRLSSGESAAEVKRSLRMPARAAERLVADASRSDPERLRRALAVLADLELDCRGGAPVTASRSPLAALSEDTLALRAIEAIAPSS